MSEPEGPDDDIDEDFDEEPKSRTGRFQLNHRGGTRVEVGEPIRVGGSKPWLCAVKLVGQKRDDVTEPEPTQTLLVRTGRGNSPEEAQREAMANLTMIYGTPVGPPPAPRIELKASQRPPELRIEPPRASQPPPRPSFIDMLKGVFGKK